MKRSRSIELVLMGTMPLLLSACGDGPAQQPQNAFAYQNLQQCGQRGKGQRGYLREGLRGCRAGPVSATGPRYNTLGELPGAVRLRPVSARPDVVGMPGSCPRWQAS